MWLQIEIPKPPYRHLKKQLPEVDSNIRFLIPIMLDKMSVERLAAGVDTMSWRSTFSTAFLSPIDSGIFTPFRESSLTGFILQLSNPCIKSLEKCYTIEKWLVSRTYEDFSYLKEII
jgi:hypothetical protein